MNCNNMETYFKSGIFVWKKYNDLQLWKNVSLRGTLQNVLTSAAQGSIQSEDLITH